MFRPGKPKTGGRRKGTVNRLTGTFRQAVEVAYNDMGGHEAFTAWAKKNQGEFYRIASKLIPVEIQKTTDTTINVIIQRDARTEPSKVINAQQAIEHLAKDPCDPT